MKALTTIVFAGLLRQTVAEESLRPSIQDLQSVLGKDGLEDEATCLLQKKVLATSDHANQRASDNASGLHNQEHVLATHASKFVGVSPQKAAAHSTTAVEATDQQVIEDEAAALVRQAEIKEREAAKAHEAAEMELRRAQHLAEEALHHRRATPHLSQTSITHGRKKIEVPRKNILGKQKAPYFRAVQQQTAPTFPGTQAREKVTEELGMKAAAAGKLKSLAGSDIVEDEILKAEHVAEHVAEQVAEANHLVDQPQFTDEIDTSSVESSTADARTNSTSEDAVDEEKPSGGGAFVGIKTHITGSPKKNKITLIALEIAPLLGPLGIDRFYLGGATDVLAWSKFAVCVCTCFVGGLVWGLVDTIAVITNCLQRQPSINILGMQAKFSSGQLTSAHALAVFAIVFHTLFCIAGCFGARAAFKGAYRRHWYLDT